MRELASLLGKKRTGPLPSTFAQMIRYPEIDQHLLSLAQDALHPGVRAMALGALIDGEAKYSDGMEWRWIDKSMGLRRRQPVIRCRPLMIRAERTALYLQGVNDKSAIVRRATLSAMIKHDLSDEKCREMARPCLLDSSAAVRSRAEFIVRHPSGL